MLAAAQPTCFLIADISGYTGYLADVELDHAQDILADLMGAVVTALRPGFRLAKLEGDAAFTFAPVERIDGSNLLDAIERCYFGFRRRRRDVRQATSCVVQRVQPDPGSRPQVRRPPRRGDHPEGRRAPGAAGFGRDRRPPAAQERGRRSGWACDAYALLSQACIDASDLDPAALGMRPHTETYDRIGEVEAWAHDLERRWQEEEARARVFVTPEESILTLSVPAKVPPQVAWEFLTAPGQRMTWQPWVTEVTIKGTTGGRRGPGSANHCMHGKDAVVEEILDWRPYDYVTDRTVIDTPTGPVKVLHTIELEPTAVGTTIHYRFAPPKTRREKALMEHIGPAYGAALEASLPGLVAQLEDRYQAGAAVAGPEPELSVPRPDGPLAGVGGA